MKPEQLGENHHQTEENAGFVQLCFVLACEYESVYIIHSDDGSYEKYCPDRDTHSLIKRGEGNNFDLALRNICDSCVPEKDRDEFLHLLSTRNLLDSAQPAAPFTAQVRFLIGEEPVYYDIKVFPCVSQELIVLCIRNADKQVRHSLRINTERRIYQSIVDAISNRYEVIYYVDTVTGNYTEYSSSEMYARLEVSKTGTDFFADTQRNLKPDIYPADYSMMSEAMKPENLLGNIRKSGSVSLNYRLMLGGVPKYVTLYATCPPDDPVHLIIAVANVDADVRREMSYREALGSAMVLANRDALTGLKNKHAYIQKENQLDERISSENKPAFAVIVCDVNGLKQINDTRGHIAGDDFIRHAGKMLCEIFSHSPVYRIGGDEFVIMLEERDYRNRAALMQQLSEQVHENLLRQEVTVSSGISAFDPAKDVCVQDVFERADRAMYEQKRCFGSIVQPASSGENTVPHDRSNPETDRL